jgi:hypothetical protein
MYVQQRGGVFGQQQRIDALVGALEMGENQHTLLSSQNPFFGFVCWVVWFLLFFFFLCNKRKSKMSLRDSQDFQLDYSIHPDNVEDGIKLFSFSLFFCFFLSFLLMPS